ncbi:MAG: hypothetical protein ABIR96_03760 [Bdellovibrionota bacterium]
MKNLFLLSLVLSLGACFPLGDTFIPRACYDHTTDPRRDYFFDVSAAVAFSRLKSALVSQGYSINQSDLSRGYIRAEFKTNLCHDPGVLEPAPEDGGTSCDLDWPVYRFGSVDVYVNNVGIGRSSVTMRIQSYNRFANDNGTLSEKSDVCPDDYSNLLSAIGGSSDF